MTSSEGGSPSIKHAAGHGLVVWAWLGLRPGLGLALVGMRSSTSLSDNRGRGACERETWREGWGAFPICYSVRGGRMVFTIIITGKESYGG